MTTRNLLIMLLCFLGLMIYLEWQSEFADPVPRPVEPVPGKPDTLQPAAVTDDLPELPQAADQAGSTGVPEPERTGELRSAERIEVETDVISARIDPVGGVLSELRLKAYPVDTDHPDEPFVLLSDQFPELHLAQAGLIDADRHAPTHRSRYRYDHALVELAPNEDEVVVPLYWRDDQGLQVTQRWIFRRGDYVIEHQIEIANQGTKPWRGSRYLRLVRTPNQSGGGMAFTNPERISYDGAAVWSAEDGFVKLPFDEFDSHRYQQMITGGWGGMVQHYFLSAWIPPAEQAHQYSTQYLTGDHLPRYALAITSLPVEVAPGAESRFDARLYAGPKVQNRLAEVAPGLDLTVDYGIFTVFSKPLFWLLDHIHSLVGNWGLAIVLLTLLIKLAFYRLTRAQFRSMGKMRKLQPRIQQLKERYGDDRQKFGQAMMEIYKKEKVNPLGGCLPVLVQIPIFIALYWVLLESVELRQASFLWVSDLSRPDPLFILPAINAVFMIITQRLTPMVGMDPIQKKVMQTLPVAFAVLFAFFPAGLVLYWATNSGISLLQQWHILRQMDAEESRKRG
ncbi:MAG: membrane protein insertase YidC [Wenzhouxiangellaceae bacterium]